MRSFSERFESLASPAFIAALALLVVNDFALKPLFHNAVTDKLSDFAGLFALTYFVAVLLPRYRHAAAAVIAGAFAFWKTSYAQPLIDTLNELAPFTLGRTVDLTDLVALPMIPLAAWAAPRLTPWPLPRVLQVGLAVVAPIAFTATTQSPGVTMRMTAEVPAATGVDASDDAALQTLFDEFAGQHGMRCMICDPIGEGRVYGTQIANLTVNYADDTRTLYVAVSDVTRRARRKVDRLGAEIRTALDERFPGMPIDEATSPFDEPVEVTEFTVRVARDGALSAERIEGARRTLSSIVEDVVRVHGLEAADTSYYAGRRRSIYQRDLSLVPSFFGNETFELRIVRHTDAYEPLHRALADDLADRLNAAFGPANVAIR